MAASQAPAEDRLLGAFKHEVGELNEPTDAVIDVLGMIYVVESAAGAVRVIGPDGATIDSWRADGALRRPTAIALGPDGKLYIADAGVPGIVVLNREGMVQRRWGSRGSGAGGLIDPRGIAVDRERVYVADAGLDRVLVFDHEGTLALAVGRRGRAEGEFRNPRDVAIDSGGNVYVADTDNHRIQKFDSRGGFVEAWGEHGSFPGLLAFPHGLSVHGESVFVADTRNHRMQVLGLDGTPVHEWGLHAPRLHVGAGTFETPVSIAVSPAGDVAVICEPVEDRVQVFGLYPGQPPPVDPVLLSMNTGSHYGAQIATAGDVLIVTEPDAAGVLVYDLDAGAIPINITRIGSFGARFGQFERMDGLAAGATGLEFHVGDSAANRVQSFRLRRDPAAAIKFDPTMAAMIRSVELRATDVDGGSLSIRPDAIARSARGDLFVLDARLASLFLFDARGEMKRRSGEFGSGPGQLSQPTSMALSADGLSLWIADSGNGRVAEFSAAGEFRTMWSGGEGESRFMQPFGICAAQDGFLYVTDRLAHQVCKVGRNGVVAQRWGSKGSLDGEFWKPTGIVQDEQGRLFVLDQGNHRVQAFSTNGEWLMTFDAGRAKRRPDVPIAD